MLIPLGSWTVTGGTDTQIMYESPALSLPCNLSRHTTDSEVRCTSSRSIIHVVVSPTIATMVVKSRHEEKERLRRRRKGNVLSLVCVGICMCARRSSKQADRKRVSGAEEI